MTAAQELGSFETSFNEVECDNSDISISERNCDTMTDLLSNSEDISANMDEKKILSDSSDTDLPGTCNEEQSRGNQNFSSDQVLKGNSDKEKDEEWLDIMGSGDFKKKIIKPGIGPDSRPNRGDIVIVDVSYYVQGNLIEEIKDLKFIVGDCDVIQGMDLIVCLMEKGEHAKVVVPSKLAYGSVGLLPDIPPDSSIECDIELKEIEMLDEEALSISERLKLGDEKRSRGNFFYDRGQYPDAIHCYERAGEYLDGVRDGSDSSAEKLQEIVNMRLKVFNNLAAAHLKLNAYGAALKSVESVLKIQPKNVKALFRKGKILGTQGLTDEAISCMKTAASLEPETKIIQVELIKLRNRKRKEEETQKAMYQKMFKTETKKPLTHVPRFNKWSMISCGVLAVAIGSAFAYKQLHT